MQDPQTGQLYNQKYGNGIFMNGANGSESPFLYAPFSQAVTASTVVIAGTAGKKIRVLGMFITGLTAGQQLTFQTQTGPTALTGAMEFAADSTLSLFNDNGLFETLVGDGLYAVLGGATNVGGFLVYVLH